MSIVCAAAFFNPSWLHYGSAVKVRYSGGNSALPAWASRWERVMVWDLWVRVGHWLVVGLIAFQFYSGEEIDLRDWHAWAGIALLSWIVFRLGWGFWGPRYARFSSFVGGPSATWQSARRLIRREHETSPGHSVIGGLGVVALMALIAVLTLTGLVSTDDIFYDAPLNHWVNSEWAGWATSIHHLAGNALIVVVAAHVSAVVWHQWVMRQALIQGMVHGRKPGGKESFGARVYIRGLIWLTVSVGLVLAVVLGAGRF